VTATTVRKIVKIDEEKCTGCALCVIPCAEGAIEIIDGKAKVMKEELCDGAGFCLAVCPEGALTVEEREAPAFDEALAEEKMLAKADERIEQQLFRLRGVGGVGRKAPPPSARLRHR